MEQAFGPANKTSTWWAFEAWQDNQLPDGQIADNALSVLKELKVNQTERGEERPFFSGGRISQTCEVYAGSHALY